jgi:hypothetical protein
MGYVRTGDEKNVTENVARETLYEAPEHRALDQNVRGERRTEQVLAGGMSAEALAGLCGAVFAILGLALHAPTLGGVAAILIGLALVMHGGSIASRWRQALHRLDRGAATSEHGGGFDRRELFGGLGTELVGGGITLALGVLAIAGVIPYVLLPVAAIVVGATVLFGGATQPELAHLAPDYDPRASKMTRGAVVASGGVMVLAGIASAVLGILALLHVGPAVTLSLIAMLCIGVALFLAGGSLAARFVRRQAWAH